MKYSILVPVIAALMTMACVPELGNQLEPENNKNPGPVETQTLVFNFNDGQQDWQAGFSDYPVGEESSYGLNGEWTTLPDEVGPGSGILLSGKNYSDDLFMYIHYRLTGLAPSQTYQLAFEVNIASNASSLCEGIGGPPGESVHVKVGATNQEPQRALESDGVLDYYRLTLDHGNQSQSGENAIVVGNIANGDDDCASQTYRRKKLNSDATNFSSTADALGNLWLLVGFDSGFEGTTSVYVTSVTVSYGAVE